MRAPVVLLLWTVGVWAMSACAVRPGPGTGTGLPCPNWAAVASRWARGESVSLYVPGDTSAHQRQYYVTVDSLLPDRGCFADSLAGALGARVGWVYRTMPAFTLSHLSDSGVARARRTPHVVDLVATQAEHLDTLVRPAVPRVTPPRR